MQGEKHDIGKPAELEDAVADERVSGHLSPQRVHIRRFLRNGIHKVSVRGEGVVGQRASIRIKDVRERDEMAASAEGIGDQGAGKQGNVALGGKAPREYGDFHKTAPFRRTAAAKINFGKREGAYLPIRLF